MIGELIDTDERLPFRILVDQKIDGAGSQVADITFKQVVGHKFDVVLSSFLQHF